MDEQLNRNERLAKDYRDLLSPEGYLVAVKLLKSPEIGSLGTVKRPEKRVTFCQLLSQARYFGRSRLVGADDQACYAPGYFFGIKELPKEAWKRYVGWQFKTEEAARLAMESVPKFPLGSYDAVFISPLERCQAAPDVVLFFGNACQMIPVIGGYLLDKGGTFTMQSNNLGGCAGVIVAPLLEKRPKIIIPGGGWRPLGLPSNTDLACGIPGAMMEELAENMQFLKSRGGSQYPPAWQHIQWEPQPPIADLLKPEGFPSWLRR